jgi:hypothetical protein
MRGTTHNDIIGKERSLTTEGSSLMTNCIVTTVQYNALVNKALLKNMMTFADNHNVETIYVYVMAGKNKDEALLPQILLEDERVEFLYLGKEGMKLNSNLKLHDTCILASQINPLTGFQKKLSNTFSYVLPSPKIRYMSLPNTSKHPRFLATTGALTHGNYKDWIAQGRKAELEHQYGFSFITVKNNRLFDFHPVEAQKNGNFHYLKESYRNGQMTHEQPEAFVLGDWHCGDTCPKTRKATISMIENLKPKRVVFHDFFNGHSVNHHERGNNLSKAQLWSKKMHILEEEVEQCLAELNFFAHKFPNVDFLISESNHDLFLARFIGTENFLEDGANSVFACRMFVEMSNKRSVPAVKLAMELCGKIASNVTFLKEDEEYRVKGVGLDYHGHRGVNGARGTSASFSNYNLRLITGHEHSPKIHPNGMVVGTSTHLKLGYTKGAGSWLNAHGLLYSSGKYTLLTIIH